eukprot:1636799-Amphidinium_carterae.1
MTSPLRGRGDKNRRRNQPHCTVRWVQLHVHRDIGARPDDELVTVNGKLVRGRMGLAQVLNWDEHHEIIAYTCVSVTGMSEVGELMLKRPLYLRFHRPCATPRQS